VATSRDEQSGNQVTANQTKVTLSSQAVALQSPAQIIAQQRADAISEANARSQAQNTTENSEVILTIGRKNMASDMQSFATDWEAAKKTIGAQRPDLLNQSWDIATDNGTVQVVSNTLSEGDKAWLTGILNQNKGLVADTQAINTTLVSTFGGTAAMAATDPSGMTLSSLNQTSVDRAVYFLSLLAGADSQANPGAPNSLFSSTAAGAVSQLSSHLASSFQSAIYSNTLNIAFAKFLSPAFFSTSAVDGTDPLGGQNIQAPDLSDLIAAVKSLMGVMTSSSPAAIGFGNGFDLSTFGKYSGQMESALSAALGSNYRTYGEAVSESNSSDAIESSGNNANPAALLADSSSRETTTSVLGPSVVIRN
jgi:hypothetical protein